MVVMAAAAITTSAQNVALGGKVGFVASTFQGDDAVDLQINKGATGGIFLHIGLVDFLTLQPELLFKQAGASGVVVNGNTAQQIKINYIEVPLLFKLRLPIDQTFYPHVLIGPQGSYAVSRKYTADGDGVADDINVRRSDVGGVVGAGMDVQSDRFFWTIDFRYGIGILNLDDNENFEYELRNSAFTLATGFGVRFGR